MARREARSPARWITPLLLLALLAGAAFYGWREYQRMVEEQPELFPWTPLTLADPVGPFTGDKLLALASDPRTCLALTADAGLADSFTDPRTPDEANCGYTDGVALGGLDLTAQPAPLVTSCPVAAALKIWEREVVAPAAEVHFGIPVTGFVHAGSYSCRRLYGRSEGGWSRHATADAVDITGFVLEDGRTVSVLNDWDGDAADAAFLREVRDGACDLFAATLSPDYNAAHADHIHLDMPSEGGTGWRACR